MEWPSQSPDLNPVKMLWVDLKRAVHARKPSNMTQLNQYCKEEWTKIPPSRCKRLIQLLETATLSYFSQSVGNTSYWN
jgi:hypothetical protein